MRCLTNGTYKKTKPTLNYSRRLLTSLLESEPRVVSITSPCGRKTNTSQKKNYPTHLPRALSLAHLPRESFRMFAAISSGRLHGPHAFHVTLCKLDAHCSHSSDASLAHCFYSCSSTAEFKVNHSRTHRRRHPPVAVAVVASPLTVRLPVWARDQTTKYLLPLMRSRPLEVCSGFLVDWTVSC